MPASPPIRPPKSGHKSHASITESPRSSFVPPVIAPLPAPLVPVSKFDNPLTQWLLANDLSQHLGVSSEFLGGDVLKIGYLDEQDVQRWARMANMSVEHTTRLLKACQKERSKRMQRQLMTDEPIKFTKPEDMDAVFRQRLRERQALALQIQELQQPCIKAGCGCPATRNSYCEKHYSRLVAKAAKELASSDVTSSPAASRGNNKRDSKVLTEAMIGALVLPLDTVGEEEALLSAKPSRPHQETLALISPALTELHSGLALSLSLALSHGEFATSRAHTIAYVKQLQARAYATQALFDRDQDDLENAKKAAESDKHVPRTVAEVRKALQEYMSELRPGVHREVQKLRQHEKRKADAGAEKWIGIAPDLVSKVALDDKMDLSRLMWVHFQSQITHRQRENNLYGSDEGTFFSIEADVFRPDIVDIRIVFAKPGRKFDPKTDGVPGYTLLARSFDNRKANLNKGGAHQSYLCYKLRGENDCSPAVTGLSLLMLNRQDQIPYCAEPVLDEREIVAKFNSNGPTLCVIRGLGPPLTALTVILRDKITFLPPPPSHECILTPEGREANINIGTVGVPTFFGINPDVRGELLPFRTHLDRVRLDMREHIRKGGDASELMAEIVMHEGQAKTLACLVAAFYSADETTVMMTFQCFRKLAGNELFPEIVNLFIQAVCRAIPMWLTYFKDSAMKSLLEFVEELYEHFGSNVSARSLLCLTQACLLLPKSSIQLAQTLIAHLHSSLSNFASKQKAPPPPPDQSPTQMCAEILFTIAANVVSSKRVQVLAVPLSRNDGNLDIVYKLVREIRVSHSSKANKATYYPDEVKSSPSLIAQSLSQVRRRTVLMTSALRQSSAEDKDKDEGDSRLHMRVEGKNTRQNSPETSQVSHNSHEENPVEMSVSRFMEPSKLLGYEVLGHSSKDKTSSPRLSVRLLEAPLSPPSGGEGDLLKDQANSDDEPEGRLLFDRLVSQESVHSPDFSEEDCSSSVSASTSSSVSASFPTTVSSSVTFSDVDIGSRERSSKKNISVPPSLTTSSSAIVTAALTSASSVIKHEYNNVLDNQEITNDTEHTDTFNAFSPKPEEEKNTPDFSLTTAETFEQTIIQHKLSIHTRKISLLEESSSANPNNAVMLNLSHDECLDTLLAILLICYQVLRTSGRCGENFQASEIMTARALSLSTHQRIQSFVIQLISFVVSDGGSLNTANTYQHHPAYTMLLRRFICPSLCRILVHPSSVVFDSSLELTALLVSTYQLPLSHELGILLDGVILGLLDCDFFRPDRKLSILNFILSSALTSPDVLLELFYNYDLHPDLPNVVQHLVLAVTSTCESVVVHEKVTGERGSSSEDWSTRLRLTCVSLLAHIVFLISAFSSSSPSCSSCPVSNGSCSCSSSNSFSPSSAPPPPPLSYSSVNSDSSSSDSSSRGQSLWKIYADKKYFAQIAEYEALRCYRKMLKRNPLVSFSESERVKKNLESALICLKNMYPLCSNREIGVVLCNFLLNFSSELDAIAIGELLSVYESEVLNKEITEIMRETYVFRLDFIDKTFDQALRLFVEESGFKLPVEKLKTERMMKAFCRAYDYQNPGALAYSASTVALAVAMSAFRCELARERGLAEKPSVLFQGKVPSLSDFTKSLQRFGTDFDHQFLYNMFESIKKQDYLDRLQRESEEVFTPEEQQEAKQVKVLARLARKAESRLNQMHSKPVAWEKKKSIGKLYEIERHLFEMCWPGLAQCFALGLRSSDESFVGLCLLGSTHVRDTGRRFANAEADMQLTTLVDGLSFRSNVLNVKKEIFNHGTLLRDRRLRLRTIHNCMQGDEVVEWLVAHMLCVCTLCETVFIKDNHSPVCSRCKAPTRSASRPEATRFGEALATVGMLPSVQGQTVGFKDNKNLYHFGTFIVWSRSEVVVVDEQKVAQNITTRSLISFPDLLFSSEKTNILTRNLRTRRLLESL